MASSLGFFGEGTRLSFVFLEEHFLYRVNGRRNLSDLNGRKLSEIEIWNWKENGLEVEGLRMRVGTDRMGR